VILFNIFVLAAYFLHSALHMKSLGPSIFHRTDEWSAKCKCTNSTSDVQVQ